MFIVKNQTFIQFRCWCRKGHLKCTDIDCDDDDDDDSNSQCRRCRKVAIRKVCGPDGRTYPNRCTALHCFGLSPVDILDGPCARHVRKQEKGFFVD